jgi:hypothetical protein
MQVFPNAIHSGTYSCDQWLQQCTYGSPTFLHLTSIAVDVGLLKLQEAVAPMVDAVSASGKRARLLQHPSARCGSDLVALQILLCYGEGSVLSSVTGTTACNRCCRLYVLHSCMLSRTYHHRACVTFSIQCAVQAMCSAAIAHASGAICKNHGQNR